MVFLYRFDIVSVFDGSNHLAVSEITKKHISSKPIDLMMRLKQSSAVQCGRKPPIALVSSVLWSLFGISVRKRVHFLRTPLQEGRRDGLATCRVVGVISTHAPARGATGKEWTDLPVDKFLLTPLREGRRQLSTNLLRDFVENRQKNTQSFIQLPWGFPSGASKAVLIA